MPRQSGNFLLQALLALSLIFAFVPFVAQQLTARDASDRMYSTTRQINTATTAARIFIRENASNIRYDKTVVTGDDFSDLLEPYGLPLGFVPRTALGQDIALVIEKNSDNISARLELSGGNLSRLQMAELARRIGFYADYDSDVVTVGIVLDDAFSDVVRRNEVMSDNTAFLTDLNMGGNRLQNAGRVIARRAEFDTASIGTLSLTGIENGRKVKNVINEMVTSRAVFQGVDGASALSLSRGALIADTVSAKTMAMYGDTGNFTSDVASVYELSMTAGRTSFTGGSQWDVRGNVVTDHISFDVERLDVSSFINVSRGQDVFVDSDEVVASSRSGIETDTLITSNVTMRDQTSDALSSGGDGAVLLDIRPAGTSLLPDVYVDSINNGAFSIIASPAKDDDKTVDCRSVIIAAGASYNQASMAQYIICQYVYWQQLEHRINIKKCMMEGGSDCK